MSGPLLAVGDGEPLFIGIAVSEYEDAGWEPLLGIAEGVARLKALLEQQGFSTQVVESPTQAELHDVVKASAQLREAGFAGPAVLVWSGHGEVISSELALIMRDTPAQGPAREMSAYRPSWLVSFLSECGSADSLLIIDACYAGAADAELLLRHVRELEDATRPGQEPAWACIVSARGYERAREGEFLAELRELLEQGPADPGPFALNWGPNSDSIPVAAVLDAIARKARGREQHPRAWQAPGSNLRFRNPGFNPVPGLVDDQIRVARGEAPRGEQLVPTPASEALTDRLRDGRPGVWFVVGGPGSGKSSCLTSAADAVGRSVLRVAAREGIAGLAATVARALPEQPVLLDALDEAPARERVGVVDLAYGWARRRFVAVAQRKSTPGATGHGLGGAEHVIDMDDPEAQGDAIERYVIRRLEEVDEGEPRPIARAVAAAAEETGTGFLLARLVIDQIVDGTLPSEREALEAMLHQRAVDVLLLESDSDDATGRALLQALALAPPPGIPNAEPWAVAAVALDDGIEPGEEPRRRLLSRLGRFIVEERVEDEVVYRLFHPALREELRRQIGGITSEGALAAVRALVELRDRRPLELAGPFLRDRLPALVAETENLILASEATEHASRDVAEAQVFALLDASADRRALGATKAAATLATAAQLAAAQHGEDLTAVAQLATVETLLHMDSWRDARDASRWARDAMIERFDAAPDRADLLLIATRATRLLARALGQGAFDAEEGVGYAGEMLKRLAQVKPDVLARVAPDVAELFLSYSHSLNVVVDPTVVVDACDASTRILGWMVEAGRADLRRPLATALTHLWRARHYAGETTSVEDFTRPLEMLVGGGPVPAGEMLSSIKNIGELTQGLGMDGLQETARHWLSRTVEAYEPAFAAAAPGDVYPLPLAWALDLRSTVLAVLERGEEALADAQRSIDITLEHYSRDYASVDDRVPLALRLVEHDRHREAVGLLREDHPLALEPTSTWSTPQTPLVLAIARSRVLLEGDDAERAVKDLSEALDAVDPGGPQPPPQNRAGRFNAYALELRIGLALSDALGAAGDIEGARAALERAAQIYLDLEAAGSPARVLHVDPPLLARYRPLLAAALVSHPGRFPGADAWRAALDLLDDAGREAVADAFGPPRTVDRPAPAVDRIIDNVASADAKAALKLVARNTYEWPAAAVVAVQLKILAGLHPQTHGALTAVAERLAADAPGCGVLEDAWDDEDELEY